MLTDSASRTIDAIELMRPSWDERNLLRQEIQAMRKWDSTVTVVIWGQAQVATLSKFVIMKRHKTRRMQ